MNIGDLTIANLCIGSQQVLSACLGTDVVWPTEIPIYSDMYLTFEVLSAGTINWTQYNADQGIGRKTISYSLNNGSWVSITPGDTISVSAGDIVKFKGTNDSYGDYDGNNNFGTSTAAFKAYGNIMSLIYGDNFSGQTSFPTGSSCNFSNLFRSCTGLTDVSNLVLPATILVTGCYFFMFYGCSSIAESPVLPASTILEDSCNQMFNGCSSLSKITCLATDISASYSTFYWTNNVAASGTFVRDSNMTSWTTGRDGIPVNWTVVDADI